MEDVNATIKAADDIVDSSLIQSMSQFKEKIEASGLFNLDNLRLNISDNDKYATAVVTMKKQNMIQDITDILKKTMNVNILYSANEEKGRRWRTVTYSMPYHEEMYIIGMESEMYGVVEQIDVTFFLSIDVMFEWLRDNLESMQKYNAMFLYIQEMTELYRIFM